MLEQDRYKTYADLTLEELENVVEDLERMSIHALKENKKSIRRQIIESAREAKKEIEKRLKNS
jgi:hypothetical protein|tara:strand:+ start:214 stop:402 length:189 start_codon:yes stop_codon:yes gene_type:complete